MNHAEMAVEVAKVAPTAPVTVMTFMGYGVADWASAATLIYVGLLIGYFVWSKLIRPWRRGHKGG